jgi:hypothetical protein
MNALLCAQTHRYSQDQLYHVVADIEHYREFVPWCQRSEVLQRRPPSFVEAELEVGFKMFVERWGLSFFLVHLYCTWRLPMLLHISRACWRRLCMSSAHQGLQLIIMLHLLHRHLGLPCCCTSAGSAHADGACGLAFSLTLTLLTFTLHPASPLGLPLLLQVSL